MSIQMPLDKRFIHKQGVEVKIKWSPQFKRAVGNTFGEGNELQKFADSTILESIEPYLPFDTGMLRNSGVNNTIIGSGKLVWKTPYARYLYYGMLMVDPVYKIGAFHDPVSGKFWSRRGIKKIVSDKPLKFRGGGKRGSFWPERWMRDNLPAFEKNLQNKAEELLKS